MIILNTKKYKECNNEFLENEFYLNQSNNILYSHNKQRNSIGKSYKSDFEISKINVLEEKEKSGKVVSKEKEMTFIEIIKEDNNIVKNVKPTCLTLKPSGFYIETNHQGLEIPCFNEYNNSTPFINSLKEVKKLKSLLPNNENDLVEYIYKEMLIRTPNISFLIHNLFWNEPKNVIVNFLSFLSVVGYEDRHQDIFYLFKGQSEDKQGQGSGKGVIQQLLEKLFSGLVVGVNNNTYNSTFNSKLQNMKVVIFDEVNFKKMNYEVVKNITGNGSLPIEFKGKESMETKNVSSWLFFTNEYDLLNKLNQNDRRCILIEPNPINNSLESRVKNELNIDMGEFIEKCKNQLSEFIYILGLSSLIKPKKPQDLKSQSHIRYYTNQNKVGIENLSILKIFTNNEHLNKFIKFYKDLPINENFYNNYLFKSEDIKFFIENKTILYVMFVEIYNICKSNGIGNIKHSVSKTWEILKENLFKNHNYENYEYMIKPTKTNKLSKKFSKSGVQDKNFVKLEKSKTKITKLIKKIYKSEIDKITNINIPF